MGTAHRLYSRVEALEREQPSNRCDFCRDWPGYRVESTSGETLEGAPATVCPHCGSGRKTIQLEPDSLGELP